MGQIHVNLEALQTGRSGVQQTYQKLRTTLEELEQGLAPMLETWTGAANESYLACKKQWDDAADALALVLNQVGTAVGTAHENYSNTHNATVRIWA